MLFEKAKSEYLLGNFESAGTEIDKAISILGDKESKDDTNHSTISPVNHILVNALHCGLIVYCSTP